MNEQQRMICVSVATRDKLDELKIQRRREGYRDTLGAIVDRLVADEYEKICVKQ